MKKAFTYITVAVLALALPLTLAHAKSVDLTASATTITPAKPTTPTKAASSTETPVETPVQPLSVRKEKIETDARALHAKFTLFATRTQLTIERLTAKDVDTSTAQADLDAATASLTDAKANIDLFTVIGVSDDAPQKNSVQLKKTLTNIQTDLTDARAHLIDSLTALKLSVATSIGTQ